MRWRRGQTMVESGYSSSRQALQKAFNKRCFAILGKHSSGSVPDSAINRQSATSMD